MKQKTMRQSSAPKKTRVNQFFSLILITLGVFLCSCSDRIHVIPVDEGTGIPVKVRVASIEQVPFGSLTKASALNEVCSRITYCIYSGEGEKPDKIQKDQTLEADNFGSMDLLLEEGTYTLVVLAHNGDGNPTMTTPSKTTFNNKKTRKATDTFLYCQEISVHENMEPVEVNLERVVAKLEFNLTDQNIPESIRKFQIEVVGTSQSLNVYTGLGLNSTKITETVDVQSDVRTYDMYMFVREGHSTMNITVTAIDSLDQEYKKMTIENVPVAKNKITRCSGEMFRKQTQTVGVSVSVNDAWAGTVERSF